ncbi:MAG: DUF6161 domain-containing protein [Flavobacteriales bacterium]
MTKEELRKKIKESDDKDWLESLEITVSLDYIGYSGTFKGLLSLYEFVNAQVKGWEKLGEGIPDVLKKSLSFFKEVKDSILFTVEKGRESMYFNRGWNYIRSCFDSTPATYPLFYNSKEVNILLDVFKHYPDLTEGVRDYLVDNINLSNKDRDYYAGMMLGYDLTKEEGISLISMKTAQEESIKELKADWTNYISDIESQYNVHVETSSKNILTHIKDARQKFDNHLNRLQKSNKDEEEKHSNWFNTSKIDFETFYQNAGEKMQILERTYEEQLRLKKPADYWRLRADGLKKQAWSSLYWLIGLVVLSAGVLFSLLWITPEGMLTSFFDGDKSLAIRWSIIFITLISFLYIGIRALIKITFSSFHLARDAEEREQLTFVYLAMVNDNSIDPADRHLIMQSLFSRADTGLLKDDSSPTMPGAGSIVEKVMNR